MGSIAYVFNNGNVHWMNTDGQLHRIDSPEFERADWYKAWIIEGNWYSEEEWRKKVAATKKEK